MPNVTIVAKTFLQSVATLDSADIARLEGFLNRLQAAPTVLGWDLNESTGPQTMGSGQLA